MSAQTKEKSAPQQETQPEGSVVKLKVAPAAAKGEDQSVQPAPTAVQASNGGAPKRSVTRKLVLGGLLLAAIAVGGKYGYDWYSVGRFEESTDDAYVQADMSQLGVKVAGYIVDIPFAENTRVNAGDIVLKLDAGDFQLAVDAAKAKIETQKAVIASIAKQIDAQGTQVSVAEAQLASAQAGQTNAAATAERTQTLVNRGVSAQATNDGAVAALRQADAAVAQANAGIAAAKAQVDVLDANKAQAQKTLDELNTALVKAERDLSFTDVKAPYAGVVANRAAEVGQYVQPGQRLMALVPDDKAYIEANFKETQLSGLHVGQKAKIEIDALGGQTYDGQVESISPASGAEFSLLPPENATGNFTKITQRVPVKVSVSPELAAKLRLGFSVVVTVDSRDKGSQ